MPIQTNTIRSILAQQSQKRLDLAANSLTEQEQRRLKGLQAALAKLQADERVPNRTLQNWLTKEQYDSIEAEWADELERRAAYADKPDEIKHYEALLKQATFAENKADYASRKGSAKAKKLINEAEAQFERALEYIDEQVQVYPHLQMWLDRSPCNEPDSTLSLVRVAMPKVVTSRSLDNYGGGASNMTIRQVKISVVERALHELLNQPDPNTAADQANSSSELGSSTLRDFLKKLQDPLA